MRYVGLICSLNQIEQGLGQIMFALFRKCSSEMFPLFTLLNSPLPASAWMSDHLLAGKPSPFITIHLGQLSLAIPPWVGAMSSSLRARAKASSG